MASSRSNLVELVVQPSASYTSLDLNTTSPVHAENTNANTINSNDGSPVDDRNRLNVTNFISSTAAQRDGIVFSPSPVTSSQLQPDGDAPSPIKQSPSSSSASTNNLYSATSSSVNTSVSNGEVALAPAPEKISDAAPQTIRNTEGTGTREKSFAKPPKTFTFWADESPWWTFRWWPSWLSLPGQRREASSFRVGGRVPRASTAFRAQHFSDIPETSPSAFAPAAPPPSAPLSELSSTLTDSRAEWWKRKTKWLRLSPTREPFWWCWYDWAQNSYRLATTFFIPTFVSMLWNGYDDQRITAESFWNYLQVASTVMVCIAYLTFCSIAEFGMLKKKMLCIFSTFGAITTALMAVAGQATMVYFVGVMYILSRIAERCAVIFYDALLKPVSYSHSKNPNSLSAEGVALGYLGLLAYAVATCASLIPAAFVKQDEGLQAYEGLGGWLNYRIPLLLCGVWWFGFMHITVFGLKNYPGKAYPYKIRGPCHFLYFAFAEGAKQQYNALKDLAHMRDLGFYTLSWLFLSDAFSTLETMIAVLAAVLWKYDQYLILIGALIVYLCAPIGLMFYRCLVLKRWATPYTILVFNTITILIASVGLLWGHVMPFLYALLAVIGFQLGTLDAFGRSIAVTMIPLSSQAQYLSFINLSSKGTSWIAPLIIAAADSIWKGSALYVTIIAVIAEGAVGTVILIFGVKHVRGIKYAEHLERERRVSLGLDTAAAECSFSTAGAMDFWASRSCSVQSEIGSENNAQELQDLRPVGDPFDDVEMRLADEGEGEGASYPRVVGKVDGKEEKKYETMGSGKVGTRTVTTLDLGGMDTATKGGVLLEGEELSPSAIVRLSRNNLQEEAAESRGREYEKGRTRSGSGIGGGTGER